MANNRNRRGLRPTNGTPVSTNPTDLPTEKITPRPGAETEEPNGNVRDNSRPARDLRAQRAAERAARAAAAADSAAAPAEGSAPLAPTAAPEPAAPATPTATPEANTTPTAALPGERIKPKPRQRTERKATTPTPTPAATPPTERKAATSAPAAVLPERIQARPSAPERIAPPAATPVSRPPTATANPPVSAQPSPAPSAASPSRTATKTSGPVERILPPERLQPRSQPQERNAGGQFIAAKPHRATAAHSNPTMRTLPGERITPRRPGEHRPSGTEDSGFEPRTYTASELRQDEEERRAAELLHPAMYWYRMDLHCHTPRSTVCYREPNATMLHILQKAEERAVDILAITDHNTVAGYGDLIHDREHVERMEQEGRLNADERYRLEEYKRIFSKLLVLPGFEFSATFGFHILCIFPPTMSIRRMEFLLMTMGITEDKMLLGSPEVGATTDVLNVYRLVTAEGGFCIGAHANSSNGIVMNGFNFGGQTKIAYTQDPNLAALEVTDLESVSRRSTPNFFNGSKPEYPRRMHCVQSSDSHRIYRDPDERQRILGVGDRTTDVLLPELSFPALKAMLFSSDWERVRPSRVVSEQPFDAIKAARTVGPNLVQAFHDRLPMRRMSSHHILRDVVAFANTNGGTIYIGVPPVSSQPLHGVDNPSEIIDVMRGEIQRNINPSLTVTMDVRMSEGKSVVLINVPKGTERPYALEGSQIYIRQENETNLAMRDEIVQLVQQALSGAEGETIFARRPPQQPQVTPPGNGRAERYERRERFVPPPRDEQPPALPQPPIASGREVDALASPPASISDPAPQVEPALIALAAPSLAAATIAAALDSGPLEHPEESRQTAIGGEQTSSGSRHRNRHRRGGRDADTGDSLGDMASEASAAAGEGPSSMDIGEPIGMETVASSDDTIIEPPHTGVEIVATEERDGTQYHTMKDLRNGNLVHHVSRHSARRLWRYAITQREHNEPKPEQITWLGDIGLWRSTARADVRRFDLAQRDAQGNFHAYYGVTEEGLHGPWLAFTSATPVEESETEEEGTEAAPAEVVSLPPMISSELDYLPVAQSDILAFADMIEQHFARMDDPHERAMSLAAHGHDHLAYHSPVPRRKRTQPLAEEMMPAEPHIEAQPASGPSEGHLSGDDSLPSLPSSILQEATLVPQVVGAHTAADEPILIEEFTEFAPPTYLPPEEVSDYIVVIDSAAVPEAAAFSDDGATSLAEARDAWNVALQPEKPKHTRAGRGRRQQPAAASEAAAPDDTQAENVEAQPGAVEVEPAITTAALQGAVTTEQAALAPAVKIESSQPITVSEEEQQVEQAVERLLKQSRSRKRGQTQAEAQAAPTEAAPEQAQASRSRSRKRTPAQAEAQPPAEASVAPQTPAEAAPATHNRPRRRSGPSDLRRGRDEDPNNPDIAPIPQLASRIEPLDERD